MYGQLISPQFKLINQPRVLVLIEGILTDHDQPLIWSTAGMPSVSDWIQEPKFAGSSGLGLGVDSTETHLWLLVLEQLINHLWFVISTSSGSRDLSSSICPLSEDLTWSTSTISPSLTGSYKLNDNWNHREPRSTWSCAEQQVLGEHGIVVSLEPYAEKRVGTWLDWDYRLSSQ